MCTHRPHRVSSSEINAKMADLEVRIAEKEEIEKQREKEEEARLKAERHSAHATHASWIEATMHEQEDHIERTLSVASSDFEVVNVATNGKGQHLDWCEGMRGSIRHSIVDYLPAGDDEDSDTSLEDTDEPDVAGQQHGAAQSPALKSPPSPMPWDVAVGSEPLVERLREVTVEREETRTSAVAELLTEWP